MLKINLLILLVMLLTTNTLFSAYPNKIFYRLDTRDMTTIADCGSMLPREDENLNSREKYVSVVDCRSDHPKLTNNKPL